MGGFPLKQMNVQRFNLIQSSPLLAFDHVLKEAFNPIHHLCPYIWKANKFEKIFPDCENISDWKVFFLLFWSIFLRFVIIIIIVNLKLFELNLFNCSVPASDQVTTKFLPTRQFHRDQTLGMDDERDFNHVLSAPVKSEQYDKQVFETTPFPSFWGVFPQRGCFFLTGPPLKI